jgi:hypothetical protein
MKPYGGVDVQIRVFGQLHPPGRFISEEIAPGTHWIGG